MGKAFRQCPLALHRWQTEKDKKNVDVAPSEKFLRTFMLLSRGRPPRVKFSSGGRKSLYLVGVSNNEKAYMPFPNAFETFWLPPCLRPAYGSTAQPVLLLA